MMLHGPVCFSNKAIRNSSLVQKVYLSQQHHVFTRNTCFQFVFDRALSICFHLADQQMVLISKTKHLTAGCFTKDHYHFRLVF